MSRNPAPRAPRRGGPSACLERARDQVGKVAGARERLVVARGIRPRAAPRAECREQRRDERRHARARGEHGKVAPANRSARAAANPCPSLPASGCPPTAAKPRATARSSAGASGCRRRARRDSLEEGRHHHPHAGVQRADRRRMVGRQHDAAERVEVAGEQRDADGHGRGQAREGRRQRPQAEREQDGEGGEAGEQIAALRLRELQVDADDDGERREARHGEHGREPPVEAAPPAARGPRRRGRARRTPA